VRICTKVHTIQLTREAKHITAFRAKIQISVHFLEGPQGTLFFYRRQS
jgi:hypothetical protein